MATIAINAPERRIGNVLVYRGTITGDSSHPAGGYSAASIAPNIDFMIFHGAVAHLWDFDAENQIIQAYDIESQVRAVATGVNLSSETVHFEAFKFVG